MKVGIYAGSFDPIHNGHIDIINRSCRLFDKVYVVIAVNAQKKGLFRFDQRMDLIKLGLEYSIQHAKETGFTHLNLNQIEVVQHQGLIANYAREVRHGNKDGQVTLIRGMRAGDMASEMSMSLINKDLGLETILLPTSKDHSHISSSMLKELATMDLSSLTNQFYLPEPVHDALIKKIKATCYT